MIIKKLPDLSALNADTVDGYHAGNLLKRTGDSMTGKLGLSSNPETHDAITISNGSDSKGHIGITGANDGILSVTTNIASVGEAKYIDVPSIPSWRSVLDTEIDSLYAGRAPAGTDTWSDLFRIDNNGNISSDIGFFGYNSVTLTVASSTASESFKEQADYVCDGTADEVQINAAIAALYNSGYPGTILLSEGIFYVSSAIGLCSNQVLKGAGMNCTIITKKNSAGAFSILSNTHQSTGDSNMVIQNLTVDGNRANNAGDAVCVLLVKVTRVLVDGVEIRHTAHDGIQFNTTCAQCVMNNCYVHDIGVSGIVPIVSGSYLVIRNCRVFNCAANGMYIHGQNYASVTGNIVDGGASVGINVVSGCTNVSVVGNVVKNCANYGIQLDSSYSTCSGNIVSNCTAHSILSENSYNTISGNVVAYGGAGGYGICSYNGGAINGVNATGNLIYSCASDGLVFQNSNNSAITGNNIIKSAWHGLYSGSASHHTLIAANLLAESCTSVDNTNYGICVDSGVTDNLVVGNKVWRGASGNRSQYDLYVGAGASNNTVLMNEFSPATGGATFPWISGYTYRASQTITPGRTAGWWVRWWKRTNGTHNVMDYNAAIAVEGLWNNVNVTDYNPGSQADYYNMRAETTFVAPATGTYTFTLIVDDGVRLWLDGTCISDHWVDGAVTYTCTAALTAGTEHDIVVEHYENAGGERLAIQFAVTGYTQQDISGTYCYSKHYSPALTNYQMRFLISNGTVGGRLSYQNGWWVRWWTKTSGTYNQMTYGTAQVEGLWNNINVSNYNPNSQADYYNMRGETTFVAPATAAYTFTVNGDDGYRLWVDGTCVLDKWTTLGTFSWTSGTFEAGSEHAVIVEHFENSGGENLSVQFSGGGVTTQDLNGTYCYSTHYPYTDGRLFLAGHSLNSMNDIRFTNSNGAVLNQWVESNDGTVAIIWVSVDSIATPPTTTTIYMFYGNAGAAASTTTSIFQFFDHFDDANYGDRWTNNSGANAWITEGGTELYTGGAYNVSVANSIATFGVNTACVFREYINSSSGEAFTGFQSSSGHKAQMHWVYTANNVTGRTNNGSDSDTGTVTTDKTNWHVYEVRRRNQSGSSGHVDFLLDGTTIQTTTTNVDTSTAMNLYFMGASNVSTVAHMDWIAVRQSAPVEPTLGVWGAEATGTFYVCDVGTNTKIGFDNSASLNRTS